MIVNNSIERWRIRLARRLFCNSVESIGWPIAVACALSIIGTVYSAYARSQDPYPNSGLGSLGAEIDKIAWSVYCNRGFSNPFGQETGATAWMPPLGVYAISGLHSVLGGNREAVVEFARVTQGIAVSAIFIPALLVMRNSRFRWLHVIVICTGVCVHFEKLFNFFHDHAWLIPASTIAWVMILHSTSRMSRRYASMVGAIGGILFLSSPVIGATWSVVTAYQLRKAVGKLAIVGAFCLAIITPWVVRNRVVLGTWIPVKSNSAFELWQSAAVSPDGLLDRNVLLLHPYADSDGPEAARYVELGEVAYVSEKRELWLDLVSEDPFDQLTRVANRAYAALIWYNPKSFEEYGGYGMPAKRAWKIFGFVCLVYLCFVRPAGVGEQAYVAAAILLLGLLPYVLMSYYERYFWPLLPMQFVVVVAAVESVLCRFSPGPNRGQLR